MVHPHDPESLAEGIAQLLANPRLRQEMGKRATERVKENFTLEKMVHRYEVLYTQLANR